jgi:hypothetical protein
MIQSSDYEWLLRDGRPIGDWSARCRIVRLDAGMKLFFKDDGRLIVPMDMMARWYL